MIKNFVKVAWRNIAKHKLHILVNVMGLAIGLCACVIIWLISSYEFSFDTFHPDRDRIYRVTGKVEESNGKFFLVEDIPPQAPVAMRQEIAGVEAVGRLYPYRPKITVQNNSERRNFDCNVEGTNTSGVIFAEPGYFSIFKYDWLAGNAVTALNDPFHVVLSESLARKYFGSAGLDNIVGREIVYDDSLTVRVSGVVRDWKGNTDFPYREFISFSTIRSSYLKQEMDRDDWQPGKENRWLWSFVKLSKGASEKRVESMLPALVSKYMKADPLNKFSIALQPLSDVHFNNEFGHDNIRKAHLPTIYGLIGIAVFLLIVASINFINLTTALSMEREKEIAVRKVLGGSSRNLVLQFLVETLLIVLLAVLIALGLTWYVLNSFAGFFPAGVSLNLLDPQTILFLVAVIIATSLLAGLYPARVLSSFVPVKILKGISSHNQGGRGRFRKGLTVFQFTLSLVFIISSIVIVNQIRFMRYSDFKFRTDAVIVLNNWDAGNGKMKVLAQQVSQLPGIGKVILQGKPPSGVTVEESLKYRGSQELEMMVSSQAGNEDFVPFYEMKIIAGRNLRQSDSLSEYVINETYTRKLGFQNPEEAIGKFLYRQETAYPIVGVIADYHEGSFHEVIGPLAIGHIPENEKSIAIKLETTGKTTENVEAQLARIKNLWQGLFPGTGFSFRFFDDMIAQMYEREQKTSRLVLTAMAVSIFIACLGLLGLVMFTTEKKKKEIGIRKVLGASSFRIIGMLSKDFLVLIVIAFLIASPVSWLMMNGWLQNFAYRIDISWWIFALSGLTTIVIALITISFHCIRAALQNPARIIKEK